MILKSNCPFFENSLILLYFSAIMLPFKIPSYRFLYSLIATFTSETFFLCFGVFLVIVNYFARNRLLLSLLPSKPTILVFLSEWVSWISDLDVF